MPVLLLDNGVLIAKANNIKCCKGKLEEDELREGDELEKNELEIDE